MKRGVGLRASPWEGCKAVGCARFGPRPGNRAVLANRRGYGVAGAAMKEFADLLPDLVTAELRIAIRCSLQENVAPDAALGIAVAAEWADPRHPSPASRVVAFRLPASDGAADKRRAAISRRLPCRVASGWGWKHVRSQGSTGRNDLSMHDFVAHISGPKLTAEIARSALPDAPVIPDPVSGGAIASGVLLRQRVSLALRRLADVVEPPASCAPVGVGCR